MTGGQVQEAGYLRVCGLASPYRKQLALESMQGVLGASEMPNLRESEYHSRLIEVVERHGEGLYYDLEDIAERWLELLRPVRRELVREQGRERLVTVERCSQKMKNDENFKPSEEELREAFRGLTKAQPLSERMTVAILGVPS